MGREMVISCLIQSRIVSLVFLLLRPLVHVQASASAHSHPVRQEWQENPEEILRQQLIWLVGIKPRLCIQKNKNLKRLLEMLMVNKRERLFVNKRGDEDAELSEDAREAREKKGRERPF